MRPPEGGAGRGGAGRAAGPRAAAARPTFVLTVPRAGRRPRWRSALAALGVAGLVLVGACGFLVAYAAFTLPSIDDLGRVTGSVRLLDRHGAPIADVALAGGSHDSVPLAQVAPVMRAAIVAAEDRQFWTEGAINPGRIVKAVFVDVLLARPAQGASTITEQLARDVYLTPEQSPMRRMREALLADEIDQRYSKQQILEMYLNTVYFGHGAYGIEDAAQAYFGVHAAQLTLAQAALIAGLPQAPSVDDPYSNPQAAFARMHYVLDGMVSTGAITGDQAVAVDPLVLSPLASVEPRVVALRAHNQQALLSSLHDTLGPGPGAAPHFDALVRDQLGDLLQADPAAALGGQLTVQTTLDLGIQQQAQAAVARGVAGIGRNANNGALLMLDPRTGAILALVGSADYGNAAIAGEFDVATAPRRPGSSFKPYVYAEAFRSGTITPSSTVDDTAQESARLGGVHDWDGRFMGPMPAWKALLLSRNVPTEQITEKAGVGNVIAFAHALGITSDLADNATTGIGTSSVRMIDQAAAYAAFANGGTTVTPHAIARVSDAAGDVLYDAHDGTATGSRVMTPEQAYGVTGILRAYNAQWHDGIDRDVAAKSGTTDNYTDAWFMAYTPDWVVATWAGHTSGSNPAEVGMDQVYGNDVGTDMAAPFINGLAPSAAFSPPPGSPTYGAAAAPAGGGETGPGAPKNPHHRKG